MQVRGQNKGNGPLPIQLPITKSLRGQREQCEASATVEQAQVWNKCGSGTNVEDKRLRCVNPPDSHPLAPTAPCPICRTFPRTKA